MSIAGYAAWHYRRRWWLAGAVLVVSLFLLPRAKGFELENDLAAWFEADDPQLAVYRAFREEFGGTRTLIVALESPQLFTRPVLRYLKRLSDELERLPHVLRVYSLATANQVIAVEGSIEVRPYLDAIEERSPDEIRRLVDADRALLGDLVSEDGTIAAITIAFDEEGSDPIRDQLLLRVRQLATVDLPPGVTLHFNGSMEISREYDRQTLINTRNYAPPMFLLICIAVYFLFRSWARVAVVLSTVVLSLGWTLAIFGLLGFRYNVLSAMIIPLIVILAISDDMHLIQRFDATARRSGDLAEAFRDAVASQVLPILAASLTTALGLLSLAASNVAAVRQFGIATAVGVVADFLISFSILPVGLTLARPRQASTPAGERLGRALAQFTRSTRAHTGLVLVSTGTLVVLSVAGIFRLRPSTNHIRFFSETNPLRRSATIIDERLSGVYTFEVILEAPPESFKDPVLLRRVDEFARQIESGPVITRAVSFLDALKKVNQALSGGGVEAHRIPDTREAVAQEIFLFSLSEAGRTDLSAFLSSDFGRMRIWAKMRSTASEEVFREILGVERLAADRFAGTSVRPVVTGAARLYSTLDTYLVESQLRSFAAAFVTVFAVIFLLFRSLRFGLLSIPPNLVPVILVLGFMGWSGIGLNAATVMVASVALGIIDDDTVHFIMHYRRERSKGADSEGALSTAVVQAGGAALLSAVINGIAFSITMTSGYRPIAYWGLLMSLTMVLAFCSEVTLLPACLRFAPRFFSVRHET